MLKDPHNQEIYDKNIFYRKSIFVLVFLLIIIAILIGRIGYIQFVKGDEYSTATYKQQTKSQVISPKRGIIYDSTGKVLARNTTVYTISVNIRKSFLSR